MITKNCDSESDVSSNSSWTVIEETHNISNPEPDTNETVKQNGKSKSGNLTDLDMVSIHSQDELELVEAPSPPESLDSDGFVKISSSTSSIKNISSAEATEEEKDGTLNRDNGFLTFDEYLQERMLEHDYNFPNKSIFKNKLKKFKKPAERRKCKAETIGVLSLCASLLTVTGIALLCLIFPDSIDTKNFETIKTNYEGIVKNDTMDYNNIVNSFNKTMEILETAKETKLINKCANSVLKDAKMSNKSKRSSFIGPISEPKVKYKTNRRNNRLSKSALPQENVCYRKDYLKSFTGGENYKKLVKPKSAKSDNIVNTGSSHSNRSKTLSAIQTVLSNTNLRCIICAIINDICMLKLVSYFNNNNSSQIQKEKSDISKKTPNKKLVRAIANSICKLSAEDILKAHGMKVTKKKNKTKEPLKPMENKSHNQIVKQDVINPLPKRKLDVMKCEPLIIQQSCCARDIISTINNKVKTKNENGKSECERRFDELDYHRQRAECVTNKHRDYIQMIKDQYRTEVASIRENVYEPCIRLHKIEQTREKFRQRLKKNREKFLKTVRKMKQQRMKMMKDICSQKSVDIECKDAAVGNYAVPIFEENDFQQKIKKIKERQMNSYAKIKPIALGRFNEYNSLKNLTPTTKRLVEKCSEKLAKADSAAAFMRSSSQDILTPRPSKSSDIVGAVERLDFKSMGSIAEKLAALNTVEDQWKTEGSVASKPPRSRPTSALGSLKERMSKRKMNGQDDEDKHNLRAAITQHKIIFEEQPDENPNDMYVLAFEKKGESIRKSDQNRWNQEKTEKYVEKLQAKELGKQDPQKSYRPNLQFRQF